VYAASKEGMGLAYMQPLTSITGGAVFLYPSIDEAALPQVLLVPPSHQLIVSLSCQLPSICDIYSPDSASPAGVLHMSARNLIMAGWARDCC